MAELTRILIAEDIETDFELARREIRSVVPRSQFHRVETREEFVAALESFRPDLIISDYSMPVFDGLSALSLALEHAPGIPVVILTGSVNEDTAVGCMKAGASDYVIKEHMKRLGPAVVSGLEKRMERVRRMEAEAALTLSNERLRQLAENIDSLLFVFDVNPAGPSVGYLSPACERIWGKTRQEIAGDPYCWMENIHPEDRPMVADLVRKMVEGGLPAAEVRYRASGSDGRRRIVRTKAQLVPSTDGRPSQIVGLAEDITGLAEAEEAKAKLEAQLVQAQKMETVGRLAGGVAHDFNNMLTVINGYSDLLLKRLDARDPIREQVNEVRKAGQRAAQLTQQLLSMSRKQITEPKVMDLNVTVADVERMLRRLIGEDIALATRLSPDLGRVMADPGQMGQVLMNLTINSRDAMPDGGELLIETANVEIGEADAARHPEASPGPYVLLSVRDSGVGMDADTQAHIFEPFFTTKGSGEGTGLGLATVHGVVKQSGGFICFDSQPGNGTTFQIYLPRIHEEAVEEVAEPAAANVHGTDTILLVEDQVDLRTLARVILAGSGYQVLEASSAEEALSVSAGHSGPIHLLVADVVMPGMNGRVLAERLHPHRPEMQVIYISGYTPDVMIRQGVIDADVNFLQKPFSPEALVLKVTDTLRRRRLNDGVQEV